MNTTLSNIVRTLVCGIIVIPLIAGCTHSNDTGKTVYEKTGKTPAIKAGMRFVSAMQGLPQTGKWKSVPAIADINNDGHADLAAIPREGKGPRVWLGDGAGVWTESSTGLERNLSCGGGVEFGDVNNDEHLDLVVADHCFGVSIFLGDGQGHWQDTGVSLRPLTMHESDVEGEQAKLFMGTEDVALGDFNEDGFLDLVLTASDQGGLQAYKGDGTATGWTLAMDGLPEEGWANGLLLIDITGDGWLDIVASYAEGPRIWAGDGQGRWTLRSEGLPRPMTGGLYRGIAIGDLNEDGLIDLAAANWVDGIEWYAQQEDGTWAKQPDIFPELRGGAIGITVADFNHDGHLDLAAAGRKIVKAGRFYGVFVFFGDGKGHLAGPLDVGLPDNGLSTSWGCAAADVNDDDIPDLMVATGGSEPHTADMPAADVDARLQVWFSCIEAAK